MLYWTVKKALWLNYLLEDAMRAIESIERRYFTRWVRIGEPGVGKTELAKFGPTTKVIDTNPPPEHPLRHRDRDLVKIFNGIEFVDVPFGNPSKHWNPIKRMAVALWKKEYNKWHMKHYGRAYYGTPAEHPQLSVILPIDEAYEIFKQQYSQPVEKEKRPKSLPSA